MQFSSHLYLKNKVIYRIKQVWNGYSCRTRRSNDFLLHVGVLYPLFMLLILSVICFQFSRNGGLLFLPSTLLSIEKSFKQRTDTYWHVYWHILTCTDNSQNGRQRLQNGKWTTNLRPNDPTNSETQKRLCYERLTS